MKTKIIAHIAQNGVPVMPLTDICTPYFARHRQNVRIMPLSCPPTNYRIFLPALFAADNCCGAVIGSPHLRRTADLVKRLSRRAAAAGACNVVRQAADGTLEGDAVAGEGLLRALRRRGFDVTGRTVLIIGCGGTGAMAAQALAEAGARCLHFYDANASSRANKLLRHLQRYYLSVKMRTGYRQDIDLVVYAASGNAANLALPELPPQTWVAAMETGGAELLRAAAANGCTVVGATATAAEQIPLYLKYFRLPTGGRPFSFSQRNSRGMDLTGSRFYLTQHGTVERF